MAIKQRKRITFIDYVRANIGDTDKLLFTDDELDSFIDLWCDTNITTTSLTCFNKKYRICGCGGGESVHDLTVTSGDAGAAYVLDEGAGIIIFDEDDPENTALTPADGNTITVSYYAVCIKELMADIFFTLSSNHAKLVLSHSIMGVSMDLSMLANSFYQTAIKWKIGGVR